MSEKSSCRHSWGSWRMRDEITHERDCQNCRALGTDEHRLREEEIGRGSTTTQDRSEFTEVFTRQSCLDCDFTRECVSYEERVVYHF